MAFCQPVTHTARSTHLLPPGPAGPPRGLNEARLRLEHGPSLIRVRVSAASVQVGGGSGRADWGPKALTRATASRPVVWGPPLPEPAGPGPAPVPPPPSSLGCKSGPGPPSLRPPESLSLAPVRPAAPLPQSIPRRFQNVGIRNLSFAPLAGSAFKKSSLLPFSRGSPEKQAAAPFLPPPAPQKTSGSLAPAPPNSKLLPL